MEVKFVVRPTEDFVVTTDTETLDHRTTDTNIANTKTIDLTESSLRECPNRDEIRRSELERLREPRNPGEALFGALFALGGMIDGISVAAGGKARGCSEE